MQPPHLHPLGDRALLCSLPAPATLPQQQRIWALAELAGSWDEVSEVVPGMNNLTLITKRPVADLDSLAQRITKTWPTLGGEHSTGRTVEIPVVYGGTAGPDLEHVARHTGLSVDEVISRHSGADYVVYFIGFLPGFAYLGGLDASLATPRHTTPRVSIPAGSVGIGGEQTGIYPMASPGGWQLIGRTSLCLFDPDQEAPTLLRPGDRVRFTVERVAS
ncbi:allophanate hydrolase [Herbaspirillum rubrisubalbicans]|jgi:KipI family sensor histidine kinase inhibitor|uniref:Allophanate hydrolase n=2 Tax=Herbaspirillum rubrisubalbicans TaxID=80842 RepID=A0ABX9BX16_9BURK|nr:5-oxoprolinase subunit PxpB [Herbaspirillum rubrisubalbicans]MCP1571777.1 KipI family sensor histidine kinase inhibitor [Herbaspirillum rubrisubalbicans]NQE48300.1 allophanate hydrolase [Herbaspirillum rubrisubalbicans]QJQ00460.1 allophanate hydrolase [Herbaspirillum rubrisubalbicans Os34]RAM62482.1 allophanate hydrolase [Herbaspirillum rubrisubalbicans]RAN50252.1 allophanate hydrolase [Herbaspirillum rubrisubalbicans]